MFHGSTFCELVDEAVEGIDPADHNAMSVALAKHYELHKADYHRAYRRARAARRLYERDTTQVCYLIYFQME